MVPLVILRLYYEPTDGHACSRTAAAHAATRCRRPDAGQRL